MLRKHKPLPYSITLLRLQSSLFHLLDLKHRAIGNYRTSTTKQWSMRLAYHAEPTNFGELCLSNFRNDRICMLPQYNPILLFIDARITKIS
jgi:hypothetical protein